jgi:hypothetical protein
MLLWSSSHVLLPPKAAKAFSYFLKGKKRVGGGCYLFLLFLIIYFLNYIYIYIYIFIYFIFFGVGLLFWNGQKNEKEKR